MSALAWLRQHQLSLLHALKTVIASLLGYLLGQYIGVVFDISEMYSWIVITVLIVMASQSNIGGMLNKAKERLLGTFLGAFAAFLVLLVLGANPIAQIIASLVLIFIAVFMATEFTRYAYTGLLSAVTVALVLLAREQDLLFASYRFLEVVLGIGIAFAVNRFLWPVHARDRLYQSYGKAVVNIAILHRQLLENSPHEDVLKKLFDLFKQQIALEQDARTQEGAAMIEDYQKINQSLRRLYRFIFVAYEYINTYPEKRGNLTSRAEFVAFHQAIDESLLCLQKNFECREIQCVLPVNKLEGQLDCFKANMITDSQFRHANTLLFSMERVLESIHCIEAQQKKVFMMSASAKEKNIAG